MNLYEFEGKGLFASSGLSIPKGVLLRRGDLVVQGYSSLHCREVVVKAQVLSGKRGKNNGVQFCSSPQETEEAVSDMFSKNISEQHVTAVLVEENISAAEEQYLSITYDTTRHQPLLLYSTQGGMDIEAVPEENIERHWLDVREKEISFFLGDRKIDAAAQMLWTCFLTNDARMVEINPLVKTMNGQWIALDAKVALDDDAFFRHAEWKEFEPRTVLGRLPTEREIAIKKIDTGEDYYRGTAGKYMEMDGDIAVLFSGGGASIANMDALFSVGLRPANYTEYSGNPPREKVYALTKIVLSKPGLKGLWIVGGVANFTNVAETFQGIVDALDEVQPTYPIVVRRAGPQDTEGMRRMEECAKRNGLRMYLYEKEMTMGDTAHILAQMVKMSEGSI